MPDYAHSEPGLLLVPTILVSVDCLEFLFLSASEVK
jgi:hypothetical protein